MKTKQSLHTIISYNMKIGSFMFLLGMAGCVEQDTPAVEQEDEAQLSDKEISLEVESWKPLVESRATLFDGENFLESNEANTLPGGNFTLYGYLAGKGTTFLGGARGWYFADTDVPEWRFRSDVTDSNGKVTATFPTYYWPNSDAVNFFAYMPYKGYQGNKENYVTIGEYTEANGQQFSCALPATNADEAKQIEFIYAYETDKTKDDKTLHLHFKHPFALVQFKWKTGAARITVNQIKLNQLCLDGVFSTNTPTAWTSTSNPQTYTAYVNKRIPNDVNYNTVFAGPYLVVPQVLDNITLVLNTKRTDSDPDKDSPSVPLSTIEGECWQPGKIYTYTLDYGDRNEEIYFNVEVEDWIVVGYTNEIEVE